MGGCCCSSRKPPLHGMPVYYYCPPALEGNESLTPHDGSASAMAAGLLFNLDLELTDTFRPPPAPLPYDVVLGCPQSTDSESLGETINGGSFETLLTCEDLEESNCKTQSSSLLLSPKKSEVSKLMESEESTTEEEDACPICLEEYDTENPKHITKCEHHFHLACILEWMERSNTLPICDQGCLFQVAVGFFIILHRFSLVTGINLRRGLDSQILDAVYCTNNMDSNFVCLSGGTSTWALLGASILQRNFSETIFDQTFDQ